MALQTPRLALQEIRETILTGSLKGIPGNVIPFPLHELAAQKWNVLREDLPLPLMVLRHSALQHNSEVMRRYVQSRGIHLAPHGKTHMAPQLFDLQIADGAWAITAATASQIQVYRRFGVQRILMANQLLGRQNISYIVNELNRDPSLDFYCLVDSADGVRCLAQQLRDFHLRRRMNVLLEAGLSGGRTGVRTLDAARQLVRQLRADSDVLAISGVEIFEGIISAEANGDETVKVHNALNSVRCILSELTPSDFSGVDAVVLSAGGSAYFDLVPATFSGVEFPVPKRIVLRSGCYLTHDSGIYQSQQERRLQRGWIDGEFQPALEVWSYVQSLPEPGLAILTMGKRDCAYDYSLPIPEKSYRPGRGLQPLADCQITALNDQHAYLKYPVNTSLQLGDLICCGISHPCTAFDKWKFIPVVDDDYRVVDGILTFF